MTKKGMLVRFVYLVISLCMWFLTLGGRFFGSNRVILCYHGINDFKAAAFRRQMLMIADRVVALDSARSSNQIRFSRPAVILTFDDAFENLLSNVIPVIEELRIPVSIYVVTGCLGIRPSWSGDAGYHHDEHELLMNSEQVKHLAGKPLVTIGTHTHSHQRLANLDSHEIKAELNSSIEILKSITGREVESVAYPHGSYNQKVSAIAEACGLTRLLTLEEQMVDAGQSSGEMGRFKMEADVWPIEFRLTVDGAYAWLHYFRRFIRLIKKTMGK